MPIPARALVQHQIIVHSVLLHEPLSKADDLMQQYDFKQIPVVDEENKPRGLVTSAMVATFKADFGSNFNQCKAEDALSRIVSTFPAEQDIFNLLDSLNQPSAILLINDLGELVNIVVRFPK